MASINFEDHLQKEVEKGKRVLVMVIPGNQPQVSYAGGKGEAVEASVQQGSATVVNFMKGLLGDCLRKKIYMVTTIPLTTRLSDCNVLAFHDPGSKVLSLAFMSDT